MLFLIDDDAFFINYDTGSGCDVGRVVNILSQRDAMHRLRIKEEYSAKYAEGLDQRLSSELSGRVKGDIHEKTGLNMSLNPTGSLGAKLSGNIKVLILRGRVYECNLGQSKLETASPN